MRTNYSFESVGLGMLKKTKPMVFDQSSADMSTNIRQLQRMKLCTCKCGASADHSVIHPQFSSRSFFKRKERSSTTQKSLLHMKARLEVIPSMQF